MIGSGSGWSHPQLRQGGTGGCKLATLLRTYVQVSTLNGRGGGASGQLPDSGSQTIYSSG